MYSCSKGASLVVAACLLAAPQAMDAQSDSANVAATVTRLEHEWARALIEQDSARLQTMLAPEYTLIVSSAAQQPVSRDVWFSTLPYYRTSALDISGLVVRVVGDVAIASFHAALNATVRGVERRGTLFITDVWMRREAGWQVIARYSSVPEPASPSTRSLRPPG